MTKSCLKTASLYGLRLRPGEDASCLNLFQPQRPRIVGLSQKFLDRGGFTFTDLLTSAPNPWQLLSQSSGDTIYTFVDAHSAQYILHRQLGEYIAVKNDRNQEVYLKIAGLLQTSIFSERIVDL